MSETNETVTAPDESEQAPLSISDDTAPPKEEEQDIEATAAAQSPAAGQNDFDSETVRLLSRLLVGFVILGNNEFLAPLRTLQHKIESDPGYTVQDALSGDENRATRLGYLSIGLFMRGRRAITSGVARGVQLSASATGWALGSVDRLTDNHLARPFRRPIEQRLQSLAHEADVIIQEGQREEESAKLIAGQLVSDITNEILDFIAENPDVEGLIQEMIGQQSMSMAGVMVDNTRQVAVAADAVAESVLRKLLRRTPRPQLPPSPLAGQPQTMYNPEHFGGGTDNHE